jgi:metalloreductase STEAP3
MITGFTAYIILSLVALSSINSIASSLNWSEWRFVQTKLGMTALVIGLLHAISMYLNIFLDKDKYNYSTSYLLTRVKLISIYFPAIVIILRIIFSYFPPIENRLNKIRDGSLVVKIV